MFAITNATRHDAAATVLTDADGRDVVVGVVRATFTLGRARRLELAAKPTPLVWADEYRGKPGKSSIAAASDITLAKPRADVIVLGSARSPGGKPVTSMTVAVRVGAANARLEVTGDRVWKKGLFGVAPGKPDSFTEMPLIWERAYGGTCPAKEGDGRVRHAPNPVGAGFWLTDRDAADQPLPNLEWPDDALKKLSDRPAAAGFGFVAPDWLPRSEFAGTYGARWEKERTPLLPEDFDPQFYNCAPAGLQLAKLEGGEPVQLEGLHADGERKFELPRDRVGVEILLPGDRFDTHAAVLDTVVIDADANLVYMIWRACVPAPEPITSLMALRFRSEQHPAPPKAAEGEPAGAGAGGARG